MRSMRTMLGMYATFAMALSTTTPPNWKEERVRKPKETDEQRNARLEKEKIERYKSKGLNQFFYGENSLYALNKKSADRKAKNNKWI